MRELLFHHEEREGHEGFGNIFAFLMAQLFFFVIFVSFVVISLRRESRKRLS
jgi:hypothetical protein